MAGLKLVYFLSTTQHDSYIEATQGKIYFSVKVVILLLLTLNTKA